uniref:Uncharacterized protein n=1 Tax=Nelumbo nucifera TaxID=4432 RepID=A0A822XUR6_NELNU|nr:TPA_asm: hypothetical protein HUJ06_024384 [Nelumbo nucifera]
MFVWSHFNAASGSLGVLCLNC